MKRTETELFSEEGGILILAVALRLPPFWPTQAPSWFTAIEADFSSRMIPEYQRKFEYAQTVFDAETQEPVSDSVDELPRAVTCFPVF